MLTTPTPTPDLKPGFAAEPKWDGFRALLSLDEGRVVLHSRRGTEMGPAFPEIVAGAAQLADATTLDGELVVWENDRLAFERLQDRLRRRGAGAARAADTSPAHFVVFDLLRLTGTNTMGWPYRRRRAVLESVFAARSLSAPWTLCPSTTNPHVVREWLTTWTTVGMEGVVFKSLDSVYSPSVRGWLKYKPRHTTEAIVGAVTGPLHAPRTLLLGRYDSAGRLQYAGRTTTLTADASTALALLLLPVGDVHPWRGWSFSAGWGTTDTLNVTLVRPERVVEIGVDVALDAAGRWRHPVRMYRVRSDMDVRQVPGFGKAAAW
ncbi:ATP-dependent DNA ligase [Streptomyces griseorubiginosus]|uniref:ATP-dependent DNA ligase n=1 Tax=Streptomyces griseorubiginosus TaxID=67304 RepID=UPI0036E6EA44